VPLPSHRARSTSRIACNNPVNIADLTGSLSSSGKESDHGFRVAREPDVFSQIRPERDDVAGNSPSIFFQSSQICFLKLVLMGSVCRSMTLLD
jgi:hypothetical protein